MGIALLIVGIIFFIVGWHFLYRKKTILKINAFIRNNVLKDIYVLTEHKKIGVFFILISIIFLYLGSIVF